MKESEAKTKRCCGPFPCGTTAEGVGSIGIGYDDEHRVDGICDVRDRYCIGSECMAWVRDPEVEDRKLIEAGYCGHIKGD